MKSSGDCNNSQTASNTSQFTSTWGSLVKSDQNSNHIQWPDSNNHTSVCKQSKISAHHRSVNAYSLHSTPCKCKCTPKIFQNTTRQAQEIRKETCKLVDNVAELYKVQPPPSIFVHSNTNIDNSIRHINESNNNNNNINQNAPSHASCRCVCDKKNNQNTIKETRISNDDDDDANDLCSLLIGLSHFHPAANLVNLDPFNVVPKISVAPPTPDANLTKSGPMLWDNLQSSNGSQNQSIDFSPDDSPQDEEPPYRSLNSSLKRFGTMSGLERIPSEETDDLLYNSSGGEDNDNTEIQISSKDVYVESNTSTARNWTNRAGSLLEQSRAFLDNYLGRWDRNKDDNDEDDNIIAENVEDCASGATSGEEIWGTPTSGDNDEMQAFHSDQGHSV